MDPLEEQLLVGEERLGLVVLAEGQTQERAEVLSIGAHDKIADLQGRRINFGHRRRIQAIPNPQHPMLAVSHTLHDYLRILCSLEQCLQLIGPTAELPHRDQVVDNEHSHVSLRLGPLNELQQANYIMGVSLLV